MHGVSGGSESFGSRGLRSASLLGGGTGSCRPLVGTLGSRLRLVHGRRLVRCGCRISPSLRLARVYFREGERSEEARLLGKPRSVGLSRGAKLRSRGASPSAWFGECLGFSLVDPVSIESVRFLGRVPVRKLVRSGDSGSQPPRLRVGWRVVERAW